MQENEEFMSKKIKNFNPEEKMKLNQADSTNMNESMNISGLIESNPLRVFS